MSNMPNPWELQQKVLDAAANENQLKMRFIENRKLQNLQMQEGLQKEGRDNTEWRSRADYTSNERFNDAIRADDAGLGGSLSVRGRDRMQAGLAVRDAAAKEFANPFGAAAFAGNMQEESGFSPVAYGDRNLGTGREAHGSFQWREERAKMRDQFYNGRPPSLDGDIQYAIQEMKTRYPKVYDGLKNAKTLAEANSYMRQYLGYANDGAHAGNESKRLATSANYLNGKMYGNDSTDLASTTGDSTEPDADISVVGDNIVGTKQAAIPSRAFGDIRDAEASRGYGVVGAASQRRGGPVTYSLERRAKLADYVANPADGTVGPPSPALQTERMNRKPTMKEFLSVRAEPVLTGRDKQSAKLAQNGTKGKQSALQVDGLDEGDDEETDKGN